MVGSLDFDCAVLALRKVTHVSFRINRKFATDSPVGFWRKSWTHGALAPRTEGGQVCAIPGKMFSLFLTRLRFGFEPKGEREKCWPGWRTQRGEAIRKPITERYRFSAYTAF